MPNQANDRGNANNSLNSQNTELNSLEALKQETDAFAALSVDLLDPNSVVQVSTGDVRSVLVQDRDPEKSAKVPREFFERPILFSPSTGSSASGICRGRNGSARCP